MGKRILTGVIGIPVLLGLLYLGGWPWMAFIAVLIAIASFEMSKIAKNMNYRLALWAIGFGEAVMIGGVFWDNEHWASLGLAVSFLLIIFQGVFAYPKISLEEMALSFMTVIYVGWSMCHLIILEKQSVVLLVYLFLAIWGSDSGAYFAGRFFGKHELAPHLSPKKTKEGSAGGILCAVALVVGYSVYLGEGAMFSLPLSVAFGVVISIIGQIGDLAASMIKRFATVKDSGHILPGQGWSLDRFDSIIMAAPFVCYIFIFLGM